MKLNNRYTFWYSIITLVVLVMGAVMLYLAVRYSTRRATYETVIGKLSQLHQDLATALADSNRHRQVPENVTITWLQDTTGVVPSRTFDSVVWVPELRSPEKAAGLASRHQVAGRHCLITSYFPLVHGTYFTAILMVFAWLLIFLLLVVIVSGEVISGYILSPLHKAIRIIRRFRPDQPVQTELMVEAADPFVKTDELRELNNFLDEMIRRTNKEFSLIREFNENAAHEIKNSVQIIYNKLGSLLLLSLPEDEEECIWDIKAEVETLHRIYESLKTLNQLKHGQYEAVSPIPFSEAVRKELKRQSESMQLKCIRLEQDVADNVQLMLHPDLSDILLTNLVGNAVAHNLPADGMIRVSLDADRLRIVNTGAKPDLPTDELFDRFKKGQPQARSAGIGLSLVKEICELHGYPVSYTYDELSALHRITIEFHQTPPASPLILKPLA